MGYIHNSDILLVFCKGLDIVFLDMVLLAIEEGLLYCEDFSTGNGEQKKNDYVLEYACLTVSVVVSYQSGIG